MKEGPSSSLQDSMDPVLLTAVIDNQKISNLTQQRVETPVIALTLPRDNLAGIAAGTYSPQVGDGYYLMVAPLPPGTHTIYIRGEATAGVFAGTVIEVTYKLTVGRTS
jgi:hypothetical protein